MKKILIIILVVILFVSLFCSLTNCTLVILLSKYNAESVELKKGDTINPLKNFDLNKGNWSAYVVLSRSDFENLSPSITKTRCLKTTDIKVLQKMKAEWNFIYKEADVATVESSIYVFNDNKLVFESAIVLDKDRQGLQNPTFGWIEPIKPNVLIESCKEFKKVHWPIVFL